MSDLLAYDAAMHRIENGEDELVPADIAERLLSGEVPLKVWREYRGHSQSGLARSSGVNRVQIADIEARRGKGSVDTIRKLAVALGIGMDDLV